MQALRNYLIATTLLLGALFIHIPIRYATPYPNDIGPQLDDRIRTTYIDLLDEEQPEILLFGDSMLGPAVDENFVAAKLGKKTRLISLPGTASTIWYLIIKNNIVLAEHTPKYLVVFFRDSMMTVPGYRVTGRYFDQIDEFASPQDTLLIERAYINQMTPLEKFMEAYIPLYSSRWTIRESIDYYIRYPLGNILLDCDTACMDYAMEVVFEESNLDVTFLSDAIGAADDYLYSEATLDFDGQVDTSFLPEVVRLCRENGIQLVLVRVPIQRFYEPGSEPPGLSAYIQSLDGYLDANDVPYLDFDQGKRMPFEYFSDTLHLNEDGKAVFTQQLTEALTTIVK
jgi:hypothetical protein